jgi:hypothetical protein
VSRAEDRRAGGFAIGSRVEEEANERRFMAADTTGNDLPYMFRPMTADLLAAAP